MKRSPEQQAQRSKEYFEQRNAYLAEMEATLAGWKAGEYLLEIGCGHGHFLTALAQRNQQERPTLRHVGIDIKSERIAKSANKTRRLGLDNVRWMCCDVFDLLERWPERCELREIYVLFPDPWPRARHHKNRFVNQRLFESLAKHCRPGAKFHYRGDFDEYTQAIREVITATERWELENKDSFAQGLPPSVFQGHHPTYQTLTATLA